jgi:hypothetical protein
MDPDENKKQLRTKCRSETGELLDWLNLTLIFTLLD